MIFVYQVCFPFFLIHPSEAAEPQTSACNITSDQKMVYIPANTKIKLSLMYPLDSKTARKGDKVFFKTLENISINNTVVIPSGSIAIGTVKMADSAGIWGQNGRLAFSADSINTVNNVKVPLSCYAKYDSANDYTFKKAAGLEAMVKTVFSTGKNIYCDAGTIYEAKVLMDTSLNITPEALSVIATTTPDNVNININIAK